jgi:hypothetical protein
METIRIQTASGLLIGSMIDDDIDIILEDQRQMLMNSNSQLGLGGKVEIF